MLPRQASNSWQSFYFSISGARIIRLISPPAKKVLIFFFKKRRQMKAREKRKRREREKKRGEEKERKEDGGRRNRKRNGFFRLYLWTISTRSHRRPENLHCYGVRLKLLVSETLGFRSSHK